MQPGQTIAPGGSAQPPEDNKPQNLEAETEVSIDNNQPDPVQPAADAGGEQEPALPAPEPAFYTSGDNSPSPQDNYQPSPSSAPVEGAVSWSASEYVAHQKSLNWFMGLGFVLAVLAMGVYLFTHDIFSPIMIMIFGIAFGVFAARPPHVLQYSVSHSGITIGEKFYSYDHFKSFSVFEDGPLHSVLLMPLQRFMPPISVYYEAQDEDRIMDVLSNYLPFTEARRDAVDSLMRRVRF